MITYFVRQFLEGGGSRGPRRCRAVWARDGDLPYEAGER